MAQLAADSEAATDSCSLCDLPTPSPPITDAAVDGAFCCRGCLEAARTLGDVDPETARAELRDADDPTDANAGDTAYRAVEGMHCGTCEAFVEGQALKTDGVAAAAASYPAGLLKVTYDPEVLDSEDLDELVDVAGYRTRDPAASEPTEQQSLGRLVVGGVLGMMAMLWYALFLYPAYLGVDPSTLLLDLEGSAGTYLLANLWVMTTVVLGYTGAPILRGALVSLRAGQPNMDLLIGLAATTAYLYSTLAALTGSVEVYFDVAIVIILAVTLGTRYEERMRRRGTDRLAELTEQRVDRARRRTPEGTETVQVEDLSAGDEVLVGSGERVPLDGTVLEGEAALDESLVTGESMPVRKTPGDRVIGGATVIDGGLVVAVDAAGESTLDRLTDLLWDVQSSRPGVQRLADRLATVFVPTVLALAVLTTAWWLLAGSSATGAVLAGLAVLVVSCPCALGLATPLAIAAGIDSALDRGIVLRNDAVLERGASVDIVAFDKTGTLSRGTLEIQSVEPIDGVSKTELLDRAGALEAFADHPLANAIEDAASSQLEVASVSQAPGRGVTGTVEGTRTIVGSLALFENDGWRIPERIASRAQEAQAAGAVPAIVGWDGEARGVITAVEEPRPGWESVLETLAPDRRIVVLTGDDGTAASRFRTHPAIDQVFAGVPPAAKTEVVDRLKAEGTVAMVGDGSNDAPALAAADLGIALERGTKLATDAADAVVTTDDLTAVPALFDVTTATRRRIRQNLGWAFLYNAIAIPLAVTGALNPLFAAVAMTASSAIVVANSARDLSS